MEIGPRLFHTTHVFQSGGGLFLWRLGISKGCKENPAVYELLANLDQTSNYFFYSLIFLHNSLNFQIAKENYAISAALLNEFYLKDVKKAVFYYRLANSISKVLPKIFYEKKIFYLSNTTEQ